MYHNLKPHKTQKITHSSLVLGRALVPEFSTILSDTSWFSTWCHNAFGISTVLVAEPSVRAVELMTFRSGTLAVEVLSLYLVSMYGTCGLKVLGTCSTCVIHVLAMCLSRGTGQSQCLNPDIVLYHTASRMVPDPIDLNQGLGPAVPRTATD